MGILLVEKQLKKNERKIGKGVVQGVSGHSAPKSISPKLVTPNLKVGGNLKVVG